MRRTIPTWQALDVADEVRLEQVLHLDCQSVLMLGLWDSRFRVPPPLVRIHDTCPGLTEPLHLGRVSRLHLVDALRIHKKGLGRDHQLRSRQLRCRLHHRLADHRRKLQRE
jgi:hypothetical protein